MTDAPRSPSALALRIFSAAAALLILWFALAFSPAGIIALGLIGCLTCAYEYANMTMATYSDKRLRWAFLAFVALTYTTFSLFADFGISTALILWASLMAAILSQIRGANDLNTALHMQGSVSLGLVYCGIVPSLIARMVQWPDRGTTWFVSLLILVFVGDTCAYFTGLSLGRKLLFPALSPKKTIEGALGGLVGSLAAGLAIWYWTFQDIPVLLFLFLCLVTSLFAQTGDLFESLIKRAANVKDSGNIMPGHGGLLDRVDGVLFALPFFYGLAYSLQFLAKS